jgi:molybdenum cofactor guanylyltransferase
MMTETTGLAVCGGRSSRMGSDKSMLQYYGIPQRYHVYAMLQLFCDEVFISCNSAQQAGIPASYATLADAEPYREIGPMAALLTACTQWPEKDLLLVGCDYPFLHTNELKRFLQICNGKPAAFFNSKSGLYEPLLAWYPAHLKPEIWKRFEETNYSLQELLAHTGAIKYTPADDKTMQSVDTIAAFETAFKQINSH